MKVWVILLGITFSVIAGAENKSVIIESGELPKSILNTSQEALAKASHACHIQKNLGQHANYIRQEIFPRIEAELQLILSPHKTNDGKVFYMGETVDYGDLFHAHVRDPLSLIQYNKEELEPQFTDKEQYHLQYHTYEYLDYLIYNWVHQLKNVNDVELQEWLKLRQEYVDFVEKNQGSWESGQPMVIDIELEPLTENQRKSFAEAWHQQLGEESPGVEHLQKKIRYVDPKDFKTGMDLLSYRSIVSTPESLHIIRPLNIKDHLQSATVYFEELSDSSKVKILIEEAQAKGFEYLVNSKSNYFVKTAFPEEKKLEEQQILLQKIFSAARETTKENPLYMFGHAYESQYDESNHVLLAWSGKYLFSIRYFLPCGDKEKALAETVSKSQSLGVLPY